MKLFHGNANPDLAASVAAYLGVPTGRARVTTFSDGEIQCEIEENVRGLDCFVVQSTSNPANDHLMELLIMVDARRSSARRITRIPPRVRARSRSFARPDHVNSSPTDLDGWV
jgi:ribose-phosphate pyrophosphokinase